MVIDLGVDRSFQGVLLQITNSLDDFGKGLYGRIQPKWKISQIDGANISSF